MMILSCLSILCALPFARFENRDPFAHWTFSDPALPRFAAKTKLVLRTQTIVFAGAPLRRQGAPKNLQCALPGSYFHRAQRSRNVNAAQHGLCHPLTLPGHQYVITTKTEMTTLTYTGAEVIISHPLVSSAPLTRSLSISSSTACTAGELSGNSVSGFCSRS